MGMAPLNPSVSGTECFSKIFGPPPGKFLATSLGRTHYILEGATDAETLIILQHGIGSNTGTFQAISEALVATGKYQVLRYDLYDRGYSETDPNKYPIESVGNHPIRFNIELYIGQIKEVLEGLKLTEKPIVHCGHSLGGLVGIAYGSSNPEKVRGLILIGAVCLPVTKPFIARIADLPLVGDFLVLNFGVNTYVNFAKACVTDQLHPAIVPLLQKMEMNCRTNPRFFASVRSTNGYCKGMVGTAEPEFRACCRSGYPIHLIWGKSDSSAPYSNCIQMKQIAEEEGCTVTELSFDGMPHNIHFPDAKQDECLQAILSFCENLEPR